MMWRTCSTCGRELPITMYSMDYATNRLRDECKTCRTKRIHRESWHRKAKGKHGGDRTVNGKTWRSMINAGMPHPGTGAEWTPQDRQTVIDHIGGRVEDVAQIIGRTPCAIRRWMSAHERWLCVSGGVICVRDECEGVESHKSA